MDPLPKNKVLVYVMAEEDHVRNGNAGHWWALLQPNVVLVRLTKAQLPKFKREHPKGIPAHLWHNYMTYRTARALTKDPFATRKALSPSTIPDPYGLTWLNPNLVHDPEIATYINVVRAADISLAERWRALCSLSISHAPMPNLDKTVVKPVEVMLANIRSRYPLLASVSMPYHPMDGMPRDQRKRHFDRGGVKKYQGALRNILNYLNALYLYGPDRKEGRP